MLPVKTNHQILIETMREGVAVVRADLWVEYVNPQLARLLGYASPEEVSGRSAAPLIVLPRSGQVRQHLQEIQDDCERFSSLWLRTAAGSALLVDVSATPLFNPAGDFTGLLCLVTDHSQRRPLELELDERRAFAQSLLDCSTDCIKQLGLDGRLQSINQQGLDIMGTNDPAILQGHLWTSFLRPAEARVAEAALEQARAGQVARCQIELQTFQGERKWTDVLVSPIRQPGGPVENLLVISRDMTELLSAQQRERMQAQKYVQILESITDAFYALDQDWNFTYVNVQAARLLKRTPEELVGQDGWEAFPEAAGTIIEDSYRQVMHERCELNFEAYFPPLDTWFEVHAYPSGEGIAVTFQDISRRKASELLEAGTNRILEMSVQAVPLPEILREVALLVERQLSGTTCYVLLREGQHWSTVAAPSLPAAYIAGFDSGAVTTGTDLSPTDGEPSAGPRGPLHCEDIASDPRWASNRDLALLHGLRASVSFSLSSAAGKPLGLLGVYKGEPGPFSEAVLHLLERVRGLATLATEHHQLRAELTFQAQHDPLSGLPNRGLFNMRLEQAIQAATGRAPLALALIDLDDFKAINDVQGHLVGDAVIQEISRRLTRCIRGGDTLARIGGDEFCVILPYADEAAAERITKRMLSAIDEPVVVGKTEVLVGASIGVSLYPEGGNDAETLRRHADLAMYAAKTRKQGVEFYEPGMNRRAAERAQMAQHLRRAIELKELELHYQPQVNLADGRWLGVEALLRWRHPVLGMVPPLQFIPIAEQTGLIIPIGEWVLRESCRQGARWQRAGHPPFRMAVNVSALQFEHSDFTCMLARALQDSGFSPDALELELTESVVMQNVDASAARMAELRALGVSIAIDDFGTGYSCLSYLPQLPLNVLKIDRSFVSKLAPGSTTLPVVRSIIGLAQSLGFTTVAEGIESVEQREMLLALGCDVGQGYLFSRPQPPEELIEMLP